MRPLTFEGFLRRYVRELSTEKTNNIYKLTREAESSNPRLREPLLLYAFFNGKEDELKNAMAHSPELEKIFSPVFAHYASPEALKRDLLDDQAMLPNEYKKAYRSFQALQNGLQNDSHTKSLMRAKIETLKQQKSITNYRIYTDLHLNPGNFNDFMRNGKLEKISLVKLRKVLNYLNNEQ
jgi:hypothetical protein